jgi:carbon storage regulator
MLIISRRKGERIVIGHDIEIVVTEVGRSTVKLGVLAPKHYSVMRGEVRDSIQEANQAALETSVDLRPDGLEGGKIEGAFDASGRQTAGAPLPVVRRPENSTGEAPNVRLDSKQRSEP